MRTKVSKSAVMTRAWKIYRGNSEYAGNFSRSLSRAWWVEKENAKPKTVEVYTVRVTPVNKKYDGYLYGAEEYYHGAGSRGRYFGD